MSTRTRKWSTVIAAATALAVGLACEHGAGSPIDQIEEDRAEDQGNLPGRRAVMSINASSSESGFTIELARIDHYGVDRHVRDPITERFGYRHLFMDFRTDDKAFSVTVYKSDASADNLIECSMGIVGVEMEPISDVAYGTDRAVCLYSTIGAEPEA